jgi:3'-phosphoadenosine 5'-phosphosulfate (PAPS) 3'-phosphatase
MATLLSMYNVDSHRVAFFVDPLDGTGCYAKGEYDAVTILTAIVLDNTPIFGIICKPFAIDMMGSGPNQNELGVVFESKSTVFQHNPVDFTHTFLNSGCFAVYGGTLLQGAFIAGDKELEASRLFYQEQEKSSTTVDDDYAHRKAIISKSRSGGVVAKCIESLASSGLLSSEPIHIAGAGYKALRLLLGYDKECLWFFPKPGTSLWDVAAADALLQVVGGRLTDKYSKPLDYSKARLEAENLDGIVASNDSTLHEICIQRFQNEAWSDDEE